MRVFTCWYQEKDFKVAITKMPRTKGNHNHINSELKEKKNNQALRQINRDYEG